jgi:hypothetical protein
MAVVKKLGVEDLVRGAVARSAKGRSPRQIANSATLHQLGYSEADVLQLKLRLLKSGSRRTLALESKLDSASVITPGSTVKAVIRTFQKILPPQSAKVTGADTPRVREVQVAVLSVLSENSPKVDFSRIEATMRLGRDLGLDEATIAEATIGVFHALSGTDFPTYFSTVNVDRSATVKEMVDQILGALPGEPSTPSKGVIHAVGRTTRTKAAAQRAGRIGRENAKSAKRMPPHWRDSFEDESGSDHEDFAYALPGEPTTPVKG